MVWSSIYDIEKTEKDFVHGTIPKQRQAANSNSYLDHICKLDIRSPPSTIRLTGIICTIGPSSIDPGVLERMMESGMNIARLNCGYSDQVFHAESIQNIRLAAENYSTRLGVTYPIGIALDIKGPEIRTGYLDEGTNPEIELAKGDQIKLTTDKAYSAKGTASMIYIDYENILKVVNVGNRIYVNHGLISLICTSVHSFFLMCTVEVGGSLGSHKIVNLPGLDTDLPAISEKDKEDLIFGLEHGVDMVFASYIREASAISEIRDILGPAGDKLLIVAKIENQQGLQNIDAIIKTSDGIMVGRGDLGIELPLEKLFLAQKSIIAKCNKAGKPVICANQLLESMINKARPTRAECTDVANAVLDGADCVQLAAESAQGIFVAETVLQMAKICKEAESAVWYKQHFNDLVNNIHPPFEPLHAIALAATETAIKCFAAAIIILTTSGRSALLTSRYRPSCPIVAVTRNAQAARQMNLARGVVPLIYTVDRLDDWTKDVELRVSYGISFGKWRRFIKIGDPVVVLNGSRKGSGFTDSLRILYVTKPSVPDEPCDYVCGDV